MILKFDEFGKINEEEGWKTNVLVGLLSLLGANTMAHKLPDQPLKTTKTYTEASAKALIAQGWHLDNTQIDTLYTQIKAEKPDTNIMVTRIKIDKSQYFESGKFTLSQDVQDSLSTSMGEIDGVITNIVVTSSTDKQGLTANLQDYLKKLGYTPDNQGLSKARAAGIKSFLVKIGVNDTLISTQEFFEQGDDEIDQSARYVSVDIYYLEISMNVLPSTGKIETSVKKTFYLSKKPTGKHQHIRGGYKSISKIGQVKTYKSVRYYRCSSFK